MYSNLIRSFGTYVFFIFKMFLGLLLINKIHLLFIICIVVKFYLHTNITNFYFDLNAVCLYFCVILSIVYSFILGWSISVVVIWFWNSQLVKYPKRSYNFFVLEHFFFLRTFIKICLYIKWEMRISICIYIHMWYFLWTFVFIEQSTVAEGKINKNNIKFEL